MPHFLDRLLPTFLALTAILFLGFSAGTSALAQEGVTAPITPIQSTNERPKAPASSPEATTAAWSATLDTAEQALTREGISEAELERITTTADGIIAEAQTLISTLEPDRNTLSGQIKELGPKPEGTQEDEAIANQRAELDARFAEIDGRIKEARLASVRANQIKARLAKLRRDRFVSSISQRSESVFNLSLWNRFATSVPVFMNSASLLLNDSAVVFVQRLKQQPWKTGALLAIIAIGTLVFWYARKLFFRFRQMAFNSGGDERLRKVSIAILSFFRLGVLNAGLVYFAYQTLELLGLLTRNLSAVLGYAALSIAFSIMAIAMARVFLSPRDAELRFADLSDPAAHKVYNLGWIAIFSVAVLFILNQTSVILVSPIAVSITLSAILALVVVILAFRILMIIASDRSDRPQGVLSEKGVFRWLHLKPFFWLAVACTAVALPFGYLAFAEFASVQILVASFVLASLWLALEFFEANRLAHFSDQDNQSSPITRLTGMRANRISQLSILGFGALKLIAILFAVIALIAPWGVRTNEWVGLMSRAFFGFQVGDLTISLSSILLAVGLFLIGYIVTRSLKAWLNNQFLPTTRLDLGLRNSISTVLGYVGIVIASMLAVGAAGIDLSNLAIVAGALSVGVGFGLQSIVNNFVSGLILLAERPIKAGDWVITSGGEGTVKKISVRSTEIETFERASVIVPNSTLITDPVTNWTHTSKFGRIGISIGVGYDSDPDQVKQILVDAMTSHPGILGKPGPDAYFMDFGDNALIFEVRGFLSNIEDGFQTKSDLRFDIFRALKKANIQIPFPQRDVHIHQAEAPQEAPMPPKRRAVKNPE